MKGREGGEERGVQEGESHARPSFAAQEHDGEEEGSWWSRAGARAHRHSETVLSVHLWWPVSWVRRSFSSASGGVRKAVKLWRNSDCN